MAAVDSDVESLVTAAAGRLALSTESRLGNNRQLMSG